MSESVRRRKSMWDSMEETHQSSPFTEKNDSFSSIDMEHKLKWSDLDANNSAKNRDSKWLPGEQRLHENISKNDEIRNLDRNSHSRRALEEENSGGWGGVMNSSHSPERIQSNRYKRSSSRSRSNSRERSRRRSRSRSRSRGSYRNRDHRSRSRSPISERRSEPHGWTESRGGGTGISSQPCRDFASTGKCRRGNQCRYLHDDNSIDQQGGLRIDKDRSERWNRQDGGNSHYHGEKDAQLRNSNISAPPCREFLKGRCQRGSSCWFPHHDASSGETAMGRSHRSSYNSSDQDESEKPKRNSKPPCKYFMMGKCHKDNCNFSHDLPQLHDSFEKNPQGDRWPPPPPKPDGTKWGDDVSTVSATKLSTGWNANVQGGSFNNNFPVENFMQGSWDKHLNTDSSNWDRPSDVLGLTGPGAGVGANGNESISFSSGISRLAHMEDKRPDGYNVPLVDYANSTNALGSYGSVGPRQPMQQVPTPLPPLLYSDTEKVEKSEQNEQVSNFLPSITHMLDPGQLPQLYAALNPPNSSIAPMPSFPHSQAPIPSIQPSNVRETTKIMESNQKDGSTIRSESSQIKKNVSGEDGNQMANPSNTMTGERNESVVPTSKEDQDTMGKGKGKETTTNNSEKEEKALKLFKVSLVELVKEILKPKWKEGQMSRELHKAIVKKVVDKVSASLQGDNIPNTPQKVEQYLAYSKTKISKLAEAYGERLKKSS